MQPIQPIQPIQSITALAIYTDGSLRRTKRGIIAGYGIFVTDPTTHQTIARIAMPFVHAPLTSNRAELYAIYRAIRYVTRRYVFDRLDIYTDSQYAQKSIVVWITRWKQNNWLTGTGKPVENIELIQKIDRLIQRHRGIRITWIPAHTGATDHASQCNAIADRLANKGADKYARLYLEQKN